MGKTKSKRGASRRALEDVDVGETIFAKETANIKLDQLIDLTYGSLKTYTDKFDQRSIQDSISIAMNYARGASELIQTAIQLKVEFYGAGFKVKISSGRDTFNDALNNRIDDWMKKHDIRQLCDDLLFDLLSADNCILQWKVNKKTNKIDYITTLPPDTVVCFPGNSDTQLGILITRALREEVLKAIAEGKERTSQFEPKIVAAVKNGLPHVMFKESDGEYWILKSRGPKFVGLRAPSMRSIFADIQIRELMINGDWSVAYMTKNLITLVTMGESIKNGPRAGTRDLYPNLYEKNAVKAQFTQIGTTRRIYGNHTLKIQHIYPDQTVLGNQKYEGVETRIDRWTRVPRVMLTGQGDGYSQSTLGKRSFEAQGERVREDMADIFRELFLHETVQEELKLPARASVKTIFNRQVLKDPKQVLDEVTALNNFGWLDVESGLDVMGYDYAEIKARKERDKEEKDQDLWQPVFEPAQGMMTPGSQDDNLDNGRPSKGGKTPEKKDGPRPSKGQ